MSASDPFFPDRPLGQAIPDTPHAVSVSLPTMRSVRGYEEKDPAITQHLALGYPRFVVHPFARALVGHLQVSQPRFAGRKLWLTSSASMAANLAAHLNARVAGGGAPAAAFEDQGVHGVAHADTPEHFQQAKLYLQHIGGFVSSREAEDQLVRRGLRHAVHLEEGFAGDARGEVWRALRPALPGAEERDLFLAPSGMNAIYAAFRAVSAVQTPRGRNEWVQLGWLYLDSIAILKKFTEVGGYHYRASVFDLGSLEKLFAERGPRIAGLITEVPTNPLIQTSDVAALAALCRRHGVHLILDPSVGSAFSAKVLPHADLLVNSLTKYTGSEGDIIAGMVVVNPAAKDAGALRRALPELVEPLYGRDLARLAAQIGQTDAVLTRINGSTPKVARFLESHPAVKEVFWALHPESAGNFAKIGRADNPGGMISFSLRGALPPFYDRLRLAKGPSFGMKTTLICPFMYLAHYDLVTTAEGRAELEANRLSPDLLRLCIGTEPPEAIIAALAEALAFVTPTP